MPFRATSVGRSLIAKLSILAFIFLFVPIILYIQFEAADDERSLLLRSSLEQRGRLIAEALRPALQTFANEPPKALNDLIARLGDEQRTIRLLFEPSGIPEADGFYLVAVSPSGKDFSLQSERRELMSTGALRELSRTCLRARHKFLRFTNPSGKEEILTSLTPLHLSNGCWVVMTSNRTAALLKSSIGKPFWLSRDVQIAAVIYLLTTGVIVWLLVDIWSGVTRFRRAARAIRLQGAEAVSFANLNKVPELAGVAEDFDALVAALAQSKELVKKAAEENAHAIKAPLAVITQAIEPLKRALENRPGGPRRSIELIERSVARLSALVTAARELDKSDADIIHSRKGRMNISTLLRRLLSSYAIGLEANGLRLRNSIEDGLFILANEDVIEPIVENLLENAASFAPPLSMIDVTLKARRDIIEFCVADRGPGVEPADAERIFDRYYSRRPPSPNVETNGSADEHFGLGLWIVKRNIAAIDGAVNVRNRASGGLIVTVSFKRCT